MSTTIAILSQKGGTGKTTLTRSLSEGLRRAGLSVLAIDADPQGNLSEYFGIPADAFPTLGEVLAGRERAVDAIHTGPGGGEVIPANLGLAEAELMLADARLIAPKPASLSMRAAAVLPLVSITAWDGLDRAGIAASSGSACASGLSEPSHVLRAMRVPPSRSLGALRLWRPQGLSEKTRSTSCRCESKRGTTTPRAARQDELATNGPAKGPLAPPCPMVSPLARGAV